MDRLTSMSVFVRVVEIGSFAAAASALGLSAPMVGKHVRFLEDRLGLRLIHRTTRRQNVTEFGRAYYERCKRVLAETTAADALAADQRSDPSGCLRVTMPVLFGRHCVAPILLALSRRHPRLELELSFNDRPVDLIEDGFDLAVRSGELGEGAGLIVRRLARQRMVVCAAPAYLARHGTPSRVEDLGAHEGILYSRSGRAKPWLFPQDGAEPQAILPPARLRLDDLDSIAEAAVAGLGLAWLPCWLIRDRVAAGALVPLLSSPAGLVFDSHALWPQAPYMPLRLRVAVDALAAGLPGLMD